MGVNLCYWILGLYLAPPLEGRSPPLCQTGYKIDKIGSGCSVLNCEPYTTQSTPEQTLPGFDSLLSLVRNNCMVLSNSSVAPANPKTGEILEVLANVIDVLQLQSNGHGGNSSKVNTLLRTVEKVIRLIAPQLEGNVSRINTNHTEVEIVVRRDRTPPRGPVRLTNEKIQLDTTWETVIGLDRNYAGFGFAVLLSYKSLLTLTQSSEVLSSRVVTAFVSNPNTTNLSEPIILTFNHMFSEASTCVYWSEDGEGAWSSQACATVISNSTHTVCSCTHLSSFALLRGIQEEKKSGNLSLVMWVGVSVALAFVVLSLLTALWCRFISKKRNGREPAGKAF
ncbi:adhesion G protein-coupled receptor E3-like [Coregonus clupeaformis]|uniref:adhesion G protein-coupled receptor E3-like n=1 Tax=Coregonus clupeaformis TaxID=59861 RepID=UPI001BE093F6|nr:adhesion G protein-coupled receptor E3-like [Coregonus clupeaformis]